MNTETLPEGYVEACKKILGGIENERNIKENRYKWKNN